MTAFGFIVFLRESSLFVQLAVVDNIDIVFWSWYRHNMQYEHTHPGKTHEAPQPVEATRVLRKEYDD